MKHFNHTAFWSDVDAQMSGCAARKDVTPSLLASLAHMSMLMEVSSAPKPGLVCPDHNGAHTDMDYSLFVSSAHALMPYLHSCALIGANNCSGEVAASMALLRQAGIQAEKNMFATTHGVNTHKGMIFSMGLLVAAAGRLLGKCEKPQPEAVAAEAASFVTGIVARDLLPLKKELPDRRLTAGEKLFIAHGIAGIRQEAEEGFPVAIMAYRSLLSLVRAGAELEHALPHVLLAIMAETADTNLIWRGGMTGLEHARASARTALQHGGMFTDKGKAFIIAMRDDFVKRNLSPGGSADLLAIAAFFLFLHEIGK